MIELVYLICWTLAPVPMDCRIVRIKKDTAQECMESANRMIEQRLAVAWCDTGRKPLTVENWLRATDKEQDKEEKEIVFDEAKYI